MSATLLEPFAYEYMTRAIGLCALVGGVCAFLSAYLTLKGWSLIGDALSHSVVPGVALASMSGLPYALGAFVSGGLAAGAMLVLSARTRLKPDVCIGLIFSGFFGVGLFINGLSPQPVRIETIVFGNALGIDPADAWQLVIIAGISLGVLAWKWRDLMAAFFDEAHARSVGLDPDRLRLLFFTLLSACTVAAMLTVGAFLVVAMVVTPGATAYLLTDRFPRLIALSVAIGTATGAAGAYLSWFVDGRTGGVIVLAQAACFALAFVLAPKHGLLAARRRARA